VAIIKEGKIIRIESVNDLSENKYKKVRIESAVNFAQVNDVEGVTNFMKKDNVYTFLYNGDINNIVTILKDSKLDDLSISEPTLEEIFMHYYE
jgi:ABC-2 type transport system ATP-binding protein